MKILVTGFDPFGGERINPAIEAVKRLPDEIKDVKIVKLEIPTVFNKSAEVVKNLQEEPNSQGIHFLAVEFGYWPKGQRHPLS